MVGYCWATPPHLCVGLQASSCGLKKLSGYNPCLTLVLTRTLKNCSAKMSMALMVRLLYMPITSTLIISHVTHVVFCCSQSPLAQIHFYLEHSLGLPMPTVNRSSCKSALVLTSGAIYPIYPIYPHSFSVPPH